MLNDLRLPLETVLVSPGFWKVQEKNELFKCVRASHGIKKYPWGGGIIQNSLQTYDCGGGP